MKKIVVTLKKWQFEMKPQYTFDLFLQRCHALGTNKFLHVQLSLFRLICPKSEEFTKGKTLGQFLHQMSPKYNKILNLSKEKSRKYTIMNGFKRNTNR